MFYKSYRNTSTIQRSYYEKCLINYGNSFDKSCKHTNVYPFTYSFIDINQTRQDNLIELDNYYSKMILELVSLKDDLFSQSHRFYRPPNLEKNIDPAIRLNKILDIPVIQKISDYICIQLQEKLFNTYVEIDKLHLYRQTVQRNANVFRGGSWTWHIDGHPAEYIKVLIYLSDVYHPPETSCFQLLVDTKTDNALKVKSKKMDDNTTTTAYQARKGQDFSDNKIQQITKQGYKIHSFLGGSGSLAIFATNCIHRATIANLKHRDTLLLRIKPSLYKVSTISPSACLS